VRPQFVYSWLPGWGYIPVPITYIDSSMVGAYISFLNVPSFRSCLQPACGRTFLVWKRWKNISSVFSCKMCVPDGVKGHFVQEKNKFVPDVLYVYKTRMSVTLWGIVSYSTFQRK
jgi:hypothetical protein